MLLRRIGKSSAHATIPKPYGLKHLGILNPHKLIRPSLHFLQRRRISSGRLSSQLNLYLHSSWLISLPGRSKGLANPTGWFTVAIETVLLCDSLAVLAHWKTKSIVSRLTSQWIPKTLSRGMLSDFKFRSLMWGALSSTGNAYKTLWRFEIHFVSWKPPLANISCYFLLMFIACFSVENDLSKSSA